ncbi:hypothetical protein CCS38_18055 [Streptomyces purpurogeneiscleroticus]|nr:hypothetical protein [Streptomyces purpurogeneiscleroticus]
MRAELAQIRARRWAQEREQCMYEYKSFAMPIMYYGDDRVIATISATVPADRRDRPGRPAADPRTVGDRDRDRHRPRPAPPERLPHRSARRHGRLSAGRPGVPPFPAA